MIRIELTPDKYKDLLDGLAIADKVQQWVTVESDCTQYDEKFKKLIDEIDFFADDLNQENS